VRSVGTWDRDEAFATAASWSVRMFQSDEGAEGMAAFREKRNPAWVANNGNS
jgi:enoyl-CoA hydratase/carnithine racemase